MRPAGQLAGLQLCKWSQIAPMAAAPAARLQDVVECNDSFSVAVKGWGSPRLVAVHGNAIYFQASTCDGRGVRHLHDDVCVATRRPRCASRAKPATQGLPRWRLGSAQAARASTRRWTRRAGVFLRACVPSCSLRVTLFLQVVMDKLMFIVLPCPAALQPAAGTRCDAAAVVAHVAAAVSTPLSVIAHNDKTPVRLPVVRLVYEGAPDTRALKWERDTTAQQVWMSNDAGTVEWKASERVRLWELTAQDHARIGQEPCQAAWLRCTTDGRLADASFQFDFDVTTAGRQVFRLRA